MRNAQCMSFSVAMQLQNKHTHRAAVCLSVSATNVAAGREKCSEDQKGKK